MYSSDKNGFKEAVYTLVEAIPPGRATSYGAIARAIGYPTMSRMVGKIMSCCEESGRDLPAHRVVNSQGQLSGHTAFGDAGEMQLLLEKEGITVRNNRICGWKRVFWDPLYEL